MARSNKARSAFDRARNPTFSPAGDETMQYLCLVYQDDKKIVALPDKELDAIVGACTSWIEDLEASGHHVFSAGLQAVSTAITLRERDGRMSSTDGPFAETKEHLGGFTIIAARDLNEAIAIASKLPAAKIGTVEVRPILRTDVELADPVDRTLAASIRRCVSVAETSTWPQLARPRDRPPRTRRDG
jgi:hypothetical protein